tara:strand:+ start:5549 stop:6031 length:483 start_codon:yes stop_codon:yes gene_type:complete
MNNYYLIDHDEDYNMKELSSKVSCKNMSELSKTYTNSQNKNFSSKIQIENCEAEKKYDYFVDKIKDDETNLFKGFSINKKSCIYKRPIYNNGNWVEQYDLSNTYLDSIQSGRLFNLQSKAKMVSNYNPNCDNMENLLGNCDKGPFYTYTQTFTNSYDNCV